MGNGNFLEENTIKETNELVKILGSSIATLKGKNKL